MNRSILVFLAIVGMIAADGEQAVDPYAEYYKHAAQERNPGYHGYSAGSSVQNPFSGVSTETSV